MYPSPHLPPCPLPLPRCGRGRGGAFTIPPAPFLSHAAGEEGGGAFTFPPAPFLSHAAGEEGGAPSPSPLPLSHREGKGEFALAVMKTTAHPVLFSARRREEGEKGGQVDDLPLSFNPLTSHLCHYCPTERTLQRIPSHPSIIATVASMIR